LVPKGASRRIDTSNRPANTSAQEKRERRISVGSEVGLGGGGLEGWIRKGLHHHGGQNEPSPKRKVFGFHLKKVGGGWGAKLENGGGGVLSGASEKEIPSCTE